MAAVNAAVDVVPDATVNGSNVVVSGDQLTSTAVAGDTVHPIERTPELLIEGVPLIANDGVVNCVMV